MKANPHDIFSKLYSWCRERDFAGFDPFDGLNSRVFQALPLKNVRTARLLWTQFFKRSPINLRSIVGIVPERNAKGIALFALAALAKYRTEQTKEWEIEANEHLDDLMSMALKGFKGPAWGYNFDWQGRAFFAPKGTPTVVPTAFAARALVTAAEVLDGDHLRYARTVCDFILNDLNRSEETADEICFSYSPRDRTRVFNASLLAGETLAKIGQLTKERSLCDFGMRAARYVIRRQRADGSWAYGADDFQSWADNFHTAFLLSSLSRIIDSCEGALDEFEPALVRGYEFWRERFFLSNGWPKYFPDRLYPADAHSAGAALVTLADLSGRMPGAMLLAEKIIEWAFDNLWNPAGYFYYQKQRLYRNRIAYMRWSEAWLCYGAAMMQEASQNRLR